MCSKLKNIMRQSKGFVSVEVIIIAGILIAGTAFTMSVFSRQASAQNEDAHAMINAGQKNASSSVLKAQEIFNGAEGSSYGIEGPAWDA